MEIWKYVEDLVSRLDEREERIILDSWIEFGQGKNEGGPFFPKGRKPKKSVLEWPAVAINDTLCDNELMVYSQLRMLHEMLAAGSNQYLSIRPNYGVGIMSSMMGAEPYVMPQEMDTLPIVRAVGEEGVRKILAEPTKLLETGYGPRVFHTAETFLEIFDRYPVLKEFVLAEPPDLQGPMDNAELLWGSDIFCALYEEPELVHELLQRITDDMRTVMDHWLTLFPGEYGVPSSLISPGHICLRDDSAMNLSPEFFREFILPYDSQLLSEYGGTVHFCGRGDHYIEIMCQQKGLYAVEMTQPHLNDMDVIFANTIDRGILLSVAYYPAELEGHCANHLYYLWNPTPPQQISE